MPSQPNPQDDPIVQILLSAYRRGQEIQREQAEKNQAAASSALNNQSPKEGQVKPTKHPPAG